MSDTKSHVVFSSTEALLEIDRHQLKDPAISSAPALHISMNGLTLVNQSERTHGVDLPAPR